MCALAILALVGLVGLAALMLCSDATGKGPAWPGLECYEGKKGKVLENGKNTFIQQVH